jgi:predicted permease
MYAATTFTRLHIYIMQSATSLTINQQQSVRLIIIIIVIIIIIIIIIFIFCHYYEIVRRRDNNCCPYVIQRNAGFTNTLHYNLAEQSI